MILIENISLSDRAAGEFHRKRLAFRPRPGEVFALVWVSSFRDPSGVTVPGFEPGYMCGPLYEEGLASPWALAQLRGGAQFYFMPRFVWSADEHYLIDKQGSLFSVAAANH